MDAVYRLSFAILGDDADARDAAQDTFVTAWRQIGKLRDADRFDAWLQRVAVNAARMTHRARRRRGVREIPSSSVAGVDGLPATASPAETDAATLDVAIRQLPVEQRSILVLHHLEGRPVDALAEILEIPNGDPSGVVVVGHFADTLAEACPVSTRDECQDVFVIDEVLPARAP